LGNVWQYCEYIRSQRHPAHGNNLRTALERLLPIHIEQKVFRRAWKNDLIYLLFNGLWIKSGLGIFSAGIIVLARALIPRSFQTAVATQPLLVQIIEVIFLADLGFYAAHRLVKSADCWINAIGARCLAVYYGR